ncbi:MAG: hypothetical protein C0501_28255 [Isosphaera sp.]|nr:hypothetical protein [Isosphaera sp.]
METPTGTGRPPVHPLAWAGFVLALASVVLGLYGGFAAEKHLADSPLRKARGSAGLPAEDGGWFSRFVTRAEKSAFGDHVDRKLLDLTARSRAANVTLKVVAFVLPLVLGVAAAYLGGWAMTAIERAGGRYRGNFPAVLAIMVGGFAAVLGGVMSFAVLVWPQI